MRRGDIVTIALGSGFGGKPRPALVVQSDAFQTSDTIIVALFTTDLRNSEQVRPRFEPTPRNGLRQSSELMVDVLATGRRSRVGGHIGTLDGTDMAVVDAALIALLGLAD